MKENLKKTTSILYFGNISCAWTKNDMLLEKYEKEKTLLNMSEQKKVEVELIKCRQNSEDWNTISLY